MISLPPDQSELTNAAHQRPPKLGRSDLARSPSHFRFAKAEIGFTLIEVIVVLVVLGLMLGLIIGRDPRRSPTFELAAATADVAHALRAARAEAILSNRQVDVVFDTGERNFRVGNGSPRTIPNSIEVLALGAASGSGLRKIGIRFAPDGSSTGGRVDLTVGERQRRIAVNWLTGQTTVTSVR